MATKFPVEVMTPEGAAWEGEAEMVSTRTVIGTIGMRANHEPIMTMLDPTELRIYTSETEIVRFAQGEGYLQMANNHMLLLVEEAFPVAELDAADLKAKYEEAESLLANAEKGSGAEARAQRDLLRWTRYLEIAENNS
jgi:F-type H+-transporting ATPase subunit epsilon